MTRKELEKLSRQGYSHREIGALFGKSRSTVGKIMQRFGIKSNTPPGPRTGPRLRTIKTCVVCGKATSKKNKAYCSTDCQREFEWEKLKHEMERTGRARAPHTAKRYLLEVRGRCCESCGITKWLRQPVLLILDHIDGNHTNWKLKNLRMICSNCDAMSPHYKGRNRGHGRFSRRQRYHNGQSY